MPISLSSDFDDLGSIQKELEKHKEETPPLLEDYVVTELTNYLDGNLSQMSHRLNAYEPYLTINIPKLAKKVYGKPPKEKKKK